MGGDALAIAAALADGGRVLAVDRDPARLAMARANAEVRGLGDRIEVCAADLGTWQPPPEADAVWCDPARRDASGRRLQAEAWSPPLSRALSLASAVRGAGVKVAPGLDRALVPDRAELEFVSMDRGLRAAVLWLGEVASTPRRATVLPEGASLAGEPDSGATAVGEPGRYLYDPDPSVGRAQLVDVLARQLGAWKLDEEVAYLTADVARETPFARRLRVLTWFPFAERRMREELRALGAARVEVMRRASPVDTNALERRLNAGLRGADGPVLSVVLTRVRGTHAALLAVRGDG